MKVNYPYWKVIIGFTLCPAVAGFFLGGVIIFEGLSSDEAYEVSDIMRFALVGPIFTSLVGFVVFCIPASIAALIYARLRLYKTWYSYLFVMLLGGVNAHIWEFIWSSNHKSLFETDLSFLLGVFSSLLVACFVIPSKRPGTAKGESE
ncbi:hypothetical protein CWI84_09520 [Idiomarina tyrosinivorans]|uniref:Uncharacterized protein n=1 Tax=Idiomarina tyrosinivorans TaxID=1445662 RepID=A0A432ZPV2_9GAMM|nr:hypothetical protein [Idiomarina tyrosinivorans]RUO79856.1 hypothetical protein CWI84_09520 [Idiomarina tyrosinivorans]